MNKRSEQQEVTLNSRYFGAFTTLKNSSAKTAFRNPMNVCQKLALRKTDSVVDVGAYVGEYSMWADSQGVASITAYEPNPRSYSILERNCRGVMSAVNAAIVGESGGTEVELFIGLGVGVTSNIIRKPRESADSVIVPAVRYEEAVKNATVVKIDIEGGEYDLDIVQPQLRGIVLEFHRLGGSLPMDLIKKTISDIKSAGFTAVSEPGFKNGWDLTGCWVREGGNV